MLREEAAQGADIAGAELLPNRYGGGQYRQLGQAYTCGNPLSGGASGGTQGFRGPGHGGIDLAACPERVSLCWNTLKFLQGGKTGESPETFSLPSPILP